MLQRARVARYRCLCLARAGASIRTVSTAPQAIPPADITTWITDLSSKPALTSAETISLERATQLHRTLPTRQAPSGASEWPGLGHAAPAQGEPLPKAFHLVYFNPDSWLKDLGKDGTSTEYNAPPPYSRRMWAGGSFSWSPTASLTVGEEVAQSVSVPKAEWKKGMVFVHQQRLLYPGIPTSPESSGDGWAVKEIRTHVFRPRLTASTPPAKSLAGEDETTPPPAPTYTFTFTPSAPLLFRYSALTWNAHRIHYDRTWTREVEGHPDLVFHGPLSATLLVELAERIALDHGRQMREFRYRATSPMYVDIPITLSASPAPEKDVWALRAEQEGRKGMSATATFA